MGCTLPGEIEWWCSQTSGFVYVDCQPSRLWLSHAWSSWHWQRLWATAYVWSKIVRPEKEKVCFLCHLSCKYTQGLAPWLCPLELPWRSSKLHPEQLANKSHIEAEGSKWRGEKTIQRPKKCRASQDDVLTGTFSCVLKLQQTVVLKGGGLTLPGRHLNLGDVGEGFHVWFFQWLSMLLAFSQQGLGTTNNL